jgi:hypothetical protein
MRELVVRQRLFIVGLRAKNLLAAVPLITAIQVNVVKGVIIMGCPNVNDCACPKTSCPNHKKCCACVIKHRETDSLPFCLFLNNEGDKSNENYYCKLKKRFETE